MKQHNPELLQIYTQSGEQHYFESFYPSNHCEHHALSEIPTESLVQFIEDHEEYFFVVDRHYRLEYANCSLLNLWGVTLEQAKGKTLAEIDYPLELQEVHERQLELVFSGRMVRGESTYFGSSGIEGQYEYTIMPLKANNGIIESAGGISRDITQRKRLEAERQQLLFALAHDLRTPLNIIYSSAELAQLELSQEDPNLKRILTNVDRLDRLIVDLLDSAKVRSGAELRLVREFCSLEKLVTSTLEELTAAYGDRFKFQSKLAPNDHLEGQWDKISIKRLIFNVVGNAVKHGHKETPIVIGLRRASDRIKLTVNNQGPVMTEEKLHDINSILQGSNYPLHMLGTEKGWGMGMLIIRGITSAYNGAARIECDAKSGTTVFVNFPIPIGTGPAI